MFNPELDTLKWNQGFDKLSLTRRFRCQAELVEAHHTANMMMLFLEPGNG